MLSNNRDAYYNTKIGPISSLPNNLMSPMQQMHHDNRDDMNLPPIINTKDPYYQSRNAVQNNQGSHTYDGANNPKGVHFTNMHKRIESQNPYSQQARSFAAGQKDDPSGSKHPLH